jgi:hypothetical protein
MKALITLVATVFIVTRGWCAEPILERVPELQKKASLANKGTLGCGVGKITLLTSRGEVTTSCGLDPVQVFGNPIKTSDLISLLKSRSVSNQSGKPGPMSGQVSDLCGVCLYALSYAKDPEVIPAIADLLTDKDDVVRGWAAIALYRLGSSSDELRKKIEVIPFPAAATASAGARGEQAPTWVTRAK